MAARDGDVPRYSYVLAVCAGLFGLPAVYGLVDCLAARSLGDFIAGGPVSDYRAAFAAAGLFALGNAVLGAAFGLWRPEKTWRWGVWLCALPTVFVSLLADGVWEFLAWEALTLAPACLGAYAAGRLHLQYVAVDEAG